MTTIRVAAALALGLALGGCQTTERVVPGSRTTVRHAWESERETREDVLKRRTEERPDDPKVWFDLADYYEEGQQFAAAIAAYERFHGLVKEVERRDGLKYTAGAYHLGRAYARAREFRGAVRFLREVLELQPSDAVAASLNPHFREAHYLLGGIYYENRQWRPAREHFVSFRELGGEPLRVEPWLAKIDEAEWSGTIRARRTDRVGEGRAAPAASAAPSAPGGE
ncbi:MAG: tetratricopeptide repeat protein [Planctomycetes bacterium]|nr:tetratricopeptide repeat protein [Planctomycetota bacterium]